MKRKLIIWVYTVAQRYDGCFMFKEPRSMRSTAEGQNLQGMRSLLRFNFFSNHGHEFCLGNLLPIHFCDAGHTNST